MVFSTAFVPYIYDTLRGGTRPDRVCWLIWSVLATMSGASNLYEGAEASMWLVGVQVTGTLVVFTLSVWRGHGAFLSRGHATILAVAAAGCCQLGADGHGCLCAGDFDFRVRTWGGGNDVEGLSQPKQ